MTLIGDRCNSTHILFFPSGLSKKAEQRAKYPGVLNKDYFSRKMVNSRQQKFVFCLWLVSWILIPQSSRKISFPGLYRFVFFISSHRSWDKHIVGLAWVNAMCGGNSNSINAVSYVKKYDLHCFCFVMSWDPLEYFHQTQPIRGKRNTSQDFIANVFPRFRKIACFDFGLPLVSCNLFLLFWWSFVTTCVWIYGTRSKYSLKRRGLWLFISMLKYRKISYPSWNLKVDIWLMLNMPQNFRSNNIQDSQGRKKAHESYSFYS